MGSDLIPIDDEPRSNAWLEKEQERNKRAKRVVIASILALVAIIAIAVSVGVVVSNKTKNRGSVNSPPPSNSSNNSTSDPGPNPNSTSIDPNDPSNFAKDSRLKRSLYGMAYAPEGSQYPVCGNSLSQVIQDIQLMSQLTKRIRLYGADCNQSALVLEAIKQTKVDMTVFLGNYVLPDDDATYLRQRDIIRSAIETYGVERIEGITVGNEFMLNYLTERGESDANGVVGNAGAALLIAYIQDTRTMLAGMNLPKTLPVGNSDAGFYFNNLALQSVDYGLSNVHAWFANVAIEAAAAWTYQFFEETNLQLARTLPNNPTMYIAETGWPTQSSDEANETNGASAASIANLQIFLNTFVCQANANGTRYFYFEYFDEKWKDETFGGVEGWWGLFHQNRTLKEITIPDCVVS